MTPDSNDAEVELYETRDEMDDGPLGLIRAAAVCAIAGVFAVYLICIAAVEVSKIIFK